MTPAISLVLGVGIALIILLSLGPAVQGLACLILLYLFARAVTRF